MQIFLPKTVDSRGLSTKNHYCIFNDRIYFIVPINLYRFLCHAYFFSFLSQLGHITFKKNYFSPAHTELYLKCAKLPENFIILNK